MIRLDDTSSETSTNSGVGGSSWQSDGTTVTYTSRAVLNVGPGSLNTRELMEYLAKHELGHCLSLAHTSNRSAAMGYQSSNVDYWARVGHFATDDLLGLHALWARDAPGFGALEGHLQYADGSAVGGGAVEALDDQTGEVLAGNVSDGQDDGRFRIESPAGRQVRLIAHPLHADAALFGDHFVPSESLTPGGFEPTEFMNSGQPAVFTVPDGSTQTIDPVMVNPPADTPLLNEDAPTFALLPGGRAHVIMHFTGLTADPPTVTASLSGSTVTNVTQTNDQVEFERHAADNATLACSADVDEARTRRYRQARPRRRALAQAGARRARPSPSASPRRAMATEVVVMGEGLDQVSGVRVFNEMDASELTAQVEGTTPDGGLRVKIDAPASAPDGPWDLQLLTPQGPAPAVPDALPRLWIGRARIQADSTVDLGDVPVGQSVPVSVQLTNPSSHPYMLSSYQWSVFQGGVSIDQNLTVSPVAPGASGTLQPQRDAHAPGPHGDGVQLAGRGRFWMRSPRSGSGASRRRVEIEP